jgi:hypothetical protein
MMCSSCKYRGWGVGFTMICRHPEHPKETTDFDSCDDYIDWDYKDIPGKNTFPRPMKGLDVRRIISHNQQHIASDN